MTYTSPGAQLLQRVTSEARARGATTVTARNVVTPEREAEWWAVDRLADEALCPSCGSRDIGTCGDSSPGILNTNEDNRTDANLADFAECEDCKWYSHRGLEAAEQERLDESAPNGPAPSEWYHGYIMMFRLDRILSTPKQEVTP